jgi:Flp pilus assembly protein TadG
MKIDIFEKFKNKLGQLFCKEEGAVAILAGLVMVVLIGFAALAIDASFWYSQKRQLQFAADAGAAGGAIALKTTGKSTINTYATNDINLNNCTSSNNCTIVAINNPPTSGPATGNTNAVEVILSKPASTFLSHLFLTTPTLHVRAVAGNPPANNCIISLNTTGVGINVKGGGNVVSSNCGIASNSSASDSINVVGGGSISTNTVTTVGQTSTSGGGSINATSGITTGASPASDPYSNLQMPTFSGCTQNNYQLTGATATISPGVYCGGIKTTSSSTLTMNPGTYFIDQGNFDISAQTTLTGTGVTIIMTSSTGSGYGSVTINGGATVNMSAPTTGSMAGILFFGDRNSSGNNEKLDGGSGQTLSGAVYFPTNNVDYSGQAGTTGNPCLQFIASTITFTGGAALGNGCQSTAGIGSTVFLE